LFLTHLLCFAIAAIGFVALYNVEEPIPESPVITALAVVVFLAVVVGIGSTAVAFALSIRDTRRAFRKTIGGAPVSPRDRGDGDQTGSHSEQPER
jgi:hypothetical protein